MAGKDARRKNEYHSLASKDCQINFHFPNCSDKAFYLETFFRSIHNNRRVAYSSAKYKREEIMIMYRISLLARRCEYRKQEIC